MKKNVFLTILLLFWAGISNAQMKNDLKYVYEFSNNVIIYTVGNVYLGYPLKTKEVITNEVSFFESYPILRFFVYNKINYINKLLVDNFTGDTTKIVNLDIDETNGFVFNILGEDFFMTLHPTCDYILDDNEEYMLFAIRVKEHNYRIFKLIK